MSNQRFSPEFKDEAVRPIVDRGYSVAEVSERLGVSAHRLYKWVKAVKPDKTDEQAAALVAARSEILKLRSHLSMNIGTSTPYSECAVCWKSHPVVSTSG